MGIHLREEQLALFMSYLHLLLFWNRKMNLTAIKDDREIVTHHFLDSLTSYRFVREEKGRILDIGTGAGFPSIPLLILEPKLTMVLVDSSKKKCFFLKEVRRELGLDFVIIRDRIEELAHQEEERATYELVLSRALAPLNILLEISLPFLKIDGMMVAYKAKEIHQEIEEAKRALSSLKGEMRQIKRVKVPFLKKDRYLLLIRKREKIDGFFPRRIHIIEKKPL